MGATDVYIDEGLCTGCGACVHDCIQHNLVLENGKAHPLRECMKCGHCVAICPEGAPSIPAYADSPIDFDPATFDLPTENLLNSIKFRRSIRAFKDEPISMEHLHLLMEAGGHTATAKNTQMCRFDFLQDSLPEFKELIWSYLSEVYETDRIMPIPAETLGRFIENRRTDPKNDYLFRDASAVLFIESPDPLDAGLAAGAIEMVAHTLGIGVLYNGYLRRVVDSCPAARAYFDMSDERGLNVCMLLGYQQKRYYRTAPRRFPSVVLR